MLATYEKRKGHSFLFKAFQKVYEKYPDTHLVICGDGSKKEKEFVINQKNLSPYSNIHLLDFIPGVQS